MTMASSEPTLGELFAVLLARDFRPEDRGLQVGANLPIARAAAVTAPITSRPDLRVILSSAATWRASLPTLRMRKSRKERSA